MQAGGGGWKAPWAAWEEDWEGQVGLWGGGGEVPFPSQHLGSLSWLGFESRILALPDVFELVASPEPPFPHLKNGKRNLCCWYSCRDEMKGYVGRA